MRGFIISISILLLFSVILSFVFFLSYENAAAEARLARTRSAPSPGYVFDDVATDLSALLGHNITALRHNTTLRVVLQGSFAEPPSAADFTAYASFLSSNYSNLTNSNLSLDVSRLADGAAEVFFTHGLLFRYAYTGASKSAILSALSGDTNASSYEVNVSVDANRQAYEPWSSSPAGDLNVTLRIVDRNGILTSTVTLNRNASNVYTIAYQGGSLAIRAGKIGTTNGALEVNPSGNIVGRTRYAVLASLPPGDVSASVRYWWNAWLNYSGPGNVSRSDWVEIGKA
ncbi:MAG: hypothetical protein QXG98_01675 [Candidatus Micrarchaeia archaeon]